jgi:hypothetical protein
MKLFRQSSGVIEDAEESQEADEDRERQKNEEPIPGQSFLGSPLSPRVHAVDVRNHG